MASPRREAGTRHEAIAESHAENLPVTKQRGPLAKCVCHIQLKGGCVFDLVSLAIDLLLSDDNSRKAIAKSNDAQIYRLMGMMSYYTRWIPLSFEKIFYLNGSDKHGDAKHKYGPHYELFFRPYKWRRIKLLEIGVGGYAELTGGRSINAWRWYFPFCKVVACDIEDRSSLKNSAVNIYQIDQSNESDLSRVVANEGSFDIIIDDGSHINAHQVFTFNKLFGSLKDGGIYVIEDIQTSYWPNEGGHHIGETGHSCMDYFLEMVNYLNACEFLSKDGARQDLMELAESISTISFHHNLIFIKKDMAKKTSNTVC
jgi:hypothetical protein